MQGKVPFLGKFKSDLVWEEADLTDYLIIRHGRFQMRKSILALFTSLIDIWSATLGEGRGLWYGKTDLGP
jgi:hypothetical protein